MIETGFAVIGTLLWGGLLGIVYFGGLWLTVRRLATDKHQAILIAGSFIIRNTFVAMGFYPVIKQGWEYALICLTGLLLVRFILIRRIKAPTF